MKHTHHLGLRAAVLTILLFMSVAAVSAQSLDGKWFKFLVTADAWRVDPDTGKQLPYKFEFYAYVHFTYVGPGHLPRGSVYDYEVWSKYAPGSWAISASSQEWTSEYSENFFEDWWLEFFTPSGGYFFTYITPRAVVPPLGNAFKAGGEIYRGDDGTGKIIYGWLTLTGQLTTKPGFAD